MAAHPSRPALPWARLGTLLAPFAAWLVVLTALAVRLLYLGGYRATPFFADPQAESLYQDRWASRIAQGDWLGQEVFFRPPLNAYLLALVNLLTRHSYLAVRVFQAGLGALTCLVVFRIARRLFGAGVGFVAGLLAAFLAGSVFYEAELLGGALVALLCVLALDLLLAAGESSAPPRLYPAGLVLGLGALAEPLLLFTLVPVGFYLLARRRHLGRTDPSCDDRLLRRRERLVAEEHQVMVEPRRADPLDQDSRGGLVRTVGERGEIDVEDLDPGDRRQRPNLHARIVGPRACRPCRISATRGAA
jgi:predicted membrane-bound mannosyltransferase